MTTQQRTRRLAYLLILFSLGAVFFTLVAHLGVRANMFAPLGIGAIAGLAAVGVLRRVRVAYYAAAVFLALVALYLAYELVSGLPLVFRHFEPSLGMLLGLGNTFSTSLLLIWLFAVGAHLLWTQPAIVSFRRTPRLIGGWLIVIGLQQLHMAWLFRDEMMFGANLTFSSRGVAMAGFPGWQIVSLLLLACGVVFCARPRWGRVAATPLALIPLVALIGYFTGGMIPDFARTGVIEFLMMAFPCAVLTYCAWWLRDECPPLGGGGSLPAQAM